MIPSRTDNESEEDQQRVVLFRFPGQGHSFGCTDLLAQYQMRSISNYLPVVEFLLVFLIKASGGWESGSVMGSEVSVN